MYCKYCGKKISEENEFCTNCGAKKEKPSQGQSNNNDQQTGVNNNEINNQPGSNQNIKKTSATAIVSLVLGIVSLFLCIFINVLTLPLSITGIILAIIAKEKSGIKVAGIILNLLSIVISILILLFLGAIFMSAWDKVKDNIDKYEYDNNNPLVGKWNCKAYDGTKEYGEYAVTFFFKDDSKFTWYKFGDEANSSVDGDYKYDAVTKTNDDIKSSKYYNVKMESKDDDSEDTYTSEYEFGINSFEDEAVVTNQATYSMYYCYKQ